MILKLLKILILTLFLFVGSLANASLMTDENYIIVDHGEETLAWAWVSNYSVQYYFEDGVLKNEFSAADTVAGWREATDTEIGYFKRDIESVSFWDSNTYKYKSAVSFFNSNPSKGISVSDFDIGDINFTYEEESTMDRFKSYRASGFFDTFYVNDVLPSASAPKPIPEPLSIIIFAMALIALQIKMRKKTS